MSYLWAWYRVRAFIPASWRPAIKVGGLQGTKAASEMIIPVRCFTCGKVIADKWRYYEREVKEMDEKKKGDGAVEEGDGAKAKLLDELGLTRICCRRHMIANVDVMDLI
jgi:DNA-directed RNA polymerase subunit N (RpoN/RPB10)